MSLNETVPGSRLPASKIILFEEDTVDAHLPKFKSPLRIRLRPDADKQIVALASDTGLNRNHLKKLAYSAFLDRIEADGQFFIMAKDERREA